MAENQPQLDRDTKLAIGSSILREGVKSDKRPPLPPEKKAGVAEAQKEVDQKAAALNERINTEAEIRAAKERVRYGSTVDQGLTNSDSTSKE